MKVINIPEGLDVDEIFLNDSQIEIIKQLNNAINNGFDNYDKYYTPDKFNQQHFNSIKHFSVFHLNIHSVEFHIEELFYNYSTYNLILYV